MTVIDSAQFARENSELSGEIAVAQLPRLHDQLANTAGTITWRMHGGVDKLQRPWLSLRVDGELQLVCQRCLKPLDWPFASEAHLTQFADEAHMDDAEVQDEDLEGILIDPALDIEALVEEEVLLAVPFAPTHEACGGVEDAPETGKKVNPFAVLAGMKTRKAE
ncbi:YceD family protein [Amantichitinum ursilacus]|uniref:Large ribosomal RNA subunit accumulation protein YceD n=1 Tax=Amantichitinum ursilacus TaxID=857265 RepID=A0A0N0XJG2_9NEIS|nr:DUF177 domain-containing protein [Amantichitinum ursilacus]KPC53268.1 hypothetical protein WG78_09265 [Amantichitinum ursilacus]